jgi:protein-disulfide isomerase
MAVGGAQRNNRKRKQKQNSAAAARAVAAARGTRNDMTKIIIGIVVIVLVAGGVIAGIMIEKQHSDQATLNIVPNLTVNGSSKYPVSFDKSTATVLVGQPSAKVSIEAYEDFECPVCGQFESTYFDSGIEPQLEAGKIKIRYHMINLLDRSTNPPGYSMLAANTAMVVADLAPNKFMDFHDSLYHKQPPENGVGWTQAQLSNLANRLGVSGPQFDSMINNKTYSAQIQKNLNAAETDKSIWLPGEQGLSTPTIIVNGQFANWQQDSNWLTTAVKAAYPAS